MKVQLIVVQGKPEGKVIPLLGPSFKIGRGEMCHLRPNSEQVSREHAEFEITSDQVTLRDLGSRNGTLVNGKALTESVTLKDRDLVQVGPLTFAVSIQDVPAAKAAPAAKPRKTTSPDDVSHDEIESWLIADSASPTPERPSGVYGGDTITITAFKENTPPKPEAKPEAEPNREESPEAEAEAEAEDEAGPTEESEIIYDKLDDEGEDQDESSSEEGAAEAPEEFIDESNPFYAKKKPEPTPPAGKPSNRDSSDAASDILRKLMERRRGPR
jgi:pSer/pThr/pTyr-binding forkhead associated (FHA) protein